MGAGFGTGQVSIPYSAEYNACWVESADKFFEPRVAREQEDGVEEKKLTLLFERAKMLRKTLFELRAWFLNDGRVDLSDLATNTILSIDEQVFCRLFG